MPTNEHSCVYCGEEIHRDPGVKGRWPTLHEDCRAPHKAEQAERERRERIEAFLSEPEPKWVTNLRDLIRAE